MLREWLPTVVFFELQSFPSPSPKPLFPKSPQNEQSQNAQVFSLFDIYRVFCIEYNKELSLTRDTELIQATIYKVEKPQQWGPIYPF